MGRQQKKVAKKTPKSATDTNTETESNEALVFRSLDDLMRAHESRRYGNRPLAFYQTEKN